ncbi:MAG TPA: hypothetical protein VK741_22485, partial [Acetobacteraceae bacterium]|nr:hypothetical protein [Acetobacteraceae bacterium]
ERWRQRLRSSGRLRRFYDTEIVRRRYNVSAATIRGSTCDRMNRGGRTFKVSASRVTAGASIAALTAALKD